MEHFVNLVNKVIKQHWNEPSLSDFHKETFTHEQIAGIIIRQHEEFKAIGIAPGDRIGLSGKNSARWAATFLAVTSYRAVAVPILYDFMPESIGELATHSECRIMFTEKKIFDKWDLTQMPDLEAAVSLDDFSLIWAKTTEIADVFNNIEKTISEKYPKGITPDDFNVVGGDPEELCLINYTSGTTGNPKGIMLPARSLSANVEYGIAQFPVFPGDQAVSMLPLAHMYGLAFEFLYKYCDNCHIYFLGKTPSPTILMASFAEVKPYQIITVPLVIEKVIKGKVLPVLEKPVMKFLCAIPGVNKLLYSTIRKQLMTAFGGKCREVILGGAALSAPIEKVLRKIKFPYTVGYGMTECGPLLGYEHHDKFVAGSCGKCVTCSEIRVDSEDPQNIVGELQCRGTNVMVGYYKDPEDTAAAFTADGWLRTGDLGIIDKEGNIFIKGRSKCMILSANGQNIYPEEIESKLNNLPYISESVVLARDKNIVGIVTLNKKEEEIAQEGKTIEGILAETRRVLNSLLPSYSHVAKIEKLKGDFVHTPKQSIKRTLYK